MTKSGRTVYIEAQPDAETPVVEMTTKRDKSGDGLANRTLLDKMDKLRELGISDMVPLPQVSTQPALRCIQQ
jgi:hypothetical protein